MLSEKVNTSRFLKVKLLEIKQKEKLLLKTPQQRKGHHPQGSSVRLGPPAHQKAARPCLGMSANQLATCLIVTMKASFTSDGKIKGVLLFSFKRKPKRICCYENFNQSITKGSSLRKIIPS